MAANDLRIVAAILVAAGSGQRLGAAVPKAFCVVAGRTLLEHAQARFSAHADVRDVVVVVPSAQIDQARELTGTDVVAGGATRQLSVAAGLAVVGEDVNLVLVHDVARPFVPAAVIDRVLAAVRAGAGAVVPVVPVTDTIRRTDPRNDELAATLDRSSLVAVQTPQGFLRTVLVAAHAGSHGWDATDDASLVEAQGGRVVAVPGSDEAFKITRPWDLALAEALAAR